MDDFCELTAVGGCGIRMAIQNPTVNVGGASGSGSGSPSDDTVVLVGNASLLSQHDIEISVEVKEITRNYRRQGKIAVYFAFQGVIRGIIALSDVIRPESKAVLACLRNRLHIQCYMVTGDDEVTVRACLYLSVYI